MQLCDPPTAATVTLGDVTVPRTSLPDDLTLGRELGCGANNRVLACERGGARLVLRAPRRRSDTQQRGSAECECRHTLRASELGAAPRVHAIWNARHANGRAWPSGLYVVAEAFRHDLDAAFERSELRARVAARRDLIGERVAECLRALAADHLFAFDLKPGNIVLDGLDGGEEGGDAAAPPLAARIIDFGRDFCEWGRGAATDASAAPHVDAIRRRIRARADARHGRPADAAEEDALVAHILFGVMLIVLAATTTHQLRADRRQNRTDARERAALNPFAHLAARFLESTRGCDRALIRHVLRMDEVRGVLRHYHGRRDAGTRRTLRFARGTAP